MKYTSLIAFITSSFLVTSCSLLRSGGYGTTATEIATYTESINRYDLDVDSQGITYTIDISTQEGKIKLNGLSLSQAQELALNEAKTKYDCATFIKPSFSHLKKGKQILRITMHGFPARYKNSSKTATPDRPQPDNNVIIVR